MTEDYTAERKLLSLLRIEDGVAYWRVRVNPGAAAHARAGWVNGKGYACVGHRGRAFLLHRLIFLDHHGYLPEMVDHIDGNPANNSAENLRAATPSQNLWNSKRRVDNASGAKNVSWHKGCQKWQVQLRVGGRRTYLGLFDTLEEASAAAEQARADTFGEFARHA